MSRIEYNRLIIEKLRGWIDKCPYLRFGQLLFHLFILMSDDEGNILDPFYEESEETYNRILDREKIICKTLNE